MIDLASVQLDLVQTYDDAARLMEWLGNRRDALAVDTETGGFEFWKQPLRLVQLGDLTHGWAVPWRDWGGLVKDALVRYTGKVVMHNAKFDWRFLDANGCKLSRDRVEDTQVMAHLVDSAGMKGLKPCGVRYLDNRIAAMQGDLKKAFAKNKWTWATVPVDFPDYWVYAAVDTVVTAGLYELLEPQVRARYQEVYELELAADWVVCDLETRGARINVEYCERKLDELTKYVDEMTSYVQKTHNCGTLDRAVAARLLSDGVPLTKRTPSGQWAVDKEVLESIDHPLAADILARRQAQKMASAYFRNLLLNRDGDVVHPDIDPIGTNTGRMSISRPALQQVPSSRSPAGTAVRDAFIAREGHRLIDVDFDQEEQRLVAHFSGDAGMAQAFREADSGGVDFFTSVARRVFHDQTITRDDTRRQRTKNGSYAIAYGAGPAKFAVTMRITLEEAERFFEQYHAAFPRFKAWQRAIEVEAREEMTQSGQPAIRTPWGRRLVGDEDTLYAMANYKIQGTAADVLKQKLVDLDSAGLGEYIVLPVHDELLFDVPEEDVEEVAKAVVEVMRETDRFSVPLTCAAAVGDTWGEVH